MATHQQACIRYTFEMPLEMSRYLKYAAIDDNMHVNAIVKTAIENWIKEREDVVDERNYLEGKKDLEDGNVVDFDTAMKGLGL